MLFTTASLLMTGCSDDDFVAVNPNASTSLTLSSTDDIVLVKDEEGETALTLNWTAPDFGFDAAPTFQVLFDLEGGDFSTVQPINAGNNLEKSFLVEELNKAVNDAGALTGIANNVIVKVQVLLGKEAVAESGTQSLVITSYANTLDLSSTWGLVGSATPNGWDGPDVPFYKTAVGNVFVAYTELTDGEIKIRENNEWTINYGAAGSGGMEDDLVQDGANIEVIAGIYKITFDLNLLAYKIEPYIWGIAGSATPNAWDGPDMQMEYDPTSDQWRALVTLVEGEIKFRLNNDWAINYGGTGGTLAEGGNNIVVSTGNYLVSANFETLEYTIEPVEHLWGLVGSATPNAWDGPDLPFSMDYANEGIWILENVTLANGEIKFRSNNDWALNYGDDGVDGTLEQDGTNIAVTAGTYTIKLDFSVESNPRYTISN